jgi:pimeloyl-ACP methyl ester carboxylesterase
MFGLHPDEVQKLLWHEPEKMRFDPSTKTDDELAIVVRNRETLALLVWEPYMHNPKLKHRLHRLTMPALFMRGASDGLVSADYLKAYAGLLPDARMVTIPKAGHLPQVEQPDSFAASVLEFLGGSVR